MQDKPFKTHDELLRILEERGVDFSAPDSKSFAKKKLQRIGYYNLVNGYSDLFWESKENGLYKSKTTIEQLYNLYIFDEKLRQIILRNILPLETNIKSLISYYFPQKHSEPNYLTYTNFDTTNKDANRNITGLISEIQRQIVFPQVPVGSGSFVVLPLGECR